MTDASPTYDGSCVIVWPNPKNGSLPQWGVVILDSESLEPLTTVTGLLVTMGTPHGWSRLGVVTAQITGLADKDNRLLPGDKPVTWDGDKIKTGEWLYLVTEMRVEA
jgi:hypothetical protein